MGDITIAGRAHKTLHVVADKWDEGGEPSQTDSKASDENMMADLQITSRTISSWVTMQI